MNTIPYFEAEYHCKRCDISFSVFHKDEETMNKHCMYCGEEVVQTGKIGRLEGNDVVYRKDGIEIERFPQKNRK